MKSFSLLSAATGLILLGLSGAASAAPIGTALPSLGTLTAADGYVEQVHSRYHRRHFRFHHHRRHHHFHHRHHHHGYR